MSTIIGVHLKPGSSRETIEQLSDGTLSIRVREPPVDGKANSALIKLLAKYLDVPKSSIKIVRGASSRLKTIEIEGVLTDVPHHRVESGEKTASVARHPYTIPRKRT